MISKGSCVSDRPWVLNHVSHAIGAYLQPAHHRRPSRPDTILMAVTMKLSSWILRYGVSRYGPNRSRVNKPVGPFFLPEKIPIKGPTGLTSLLPVWPRALKIKPRSPARVLHRPLFSSPQQLFGVSFDVSMFFCIYFPWTHFRVSSRCGKDTRGK